MSKPPEETESRPLVSGTTILILSVFLIGVAIGRWGAASWISYVLVCGLAGVLAFIGLDVARICRVEEACLQVQRNIASRLMRHVSRDRMNRPEEAGREVTQNESEELP